MMGLFKREPKIVRCKMLVSVAAVDWAYDPEQIVDWPSELAEQFFDTGKAVLAEPDAELAAGIATRCPVGHDPRTEDTSDICFYCSRM